jgi:hypothetical protein
MGGYSRGKGILPPDMEERWQKERAAEYREQAAKEHQTDEVRPSRWRRLVGWWPGHRRSDDTG